MARRKFRAELFPADDAAQNRPVGMRLCLLKAIFGPESFQEGARRRNLASALPFSFVLGMTVPSNERKTTMRVGLGYTSRIIGTVMLVALASTAANAACGGGGYRPAPARHQAVSSDSSVSRSSERTQVQEVAYKRPETKIYEKRHFDAVANGLDLTKAQRQAVVTITNESSRRADEFKRSTKDAQALKRSLDGLEADTEKQLARVLSMAQLDAYKRGEASADYDRFR
jgi:hypothetical protein